MTTIDVIDPSALSPVIDPAAGYAQLVNDGIIARQAMDTGRWILGGNVRKLVTYYRERTVEQYADDVKVQATSLYEYAGMASFYPVEIRDQLSELDLTYSHYREARRLKDLDKAIEFLKAIALNHWTIDQTRAALRELKRCGTLVSPTYSDSSPVTTFDNQRIDQRPVYQWRGPATVSIDAKGIVRLQCDHAPEIEQGKRYIVSFEEIEP